MMTTRKSAEVPVSWGDSLSHARKAAQTENQGFLGPEAFHREIEREKHRTNRTAAPFTLILFGLKVQTPSSRKESLALDGLVAIMNKVTRASDIKGWFMADDRVSVGVLMQNTSSVEAEILQKRVLAHVESSSVGRQQLVYSIYSYPESAEDNQVSENEDCTKRNNQELYKATESELAVPGWKRILDIVGALGALVILSPIWFLIGFYVKFVSPGPILFKQKRVGIGGKYFQMIKFRTMSVNVDPDAHRRYVESLISSNTGDSERPMVKLEDRPEIIPGGKVIRSLCLDEIPQLLNVLKGEMSLVGPRPALEYEVSQYCDWHRHRLNALPGMTGLWQVSGKNRLSFNEMVRLDIRYARNLSISRDIWILLMTIPAICGQIYDTICRSKNLMEKVPENA
jgi:lipopolysaccharide/colanic/teichoic acid biosynthesis glycosyltransferase